MLTLFNTLRAFSVIHLLGFPFCSKFVCILPEDILSRVHFPSSPCLSSTTSKASFILSSFAWPSLVTTSSPLRMS